MVKTELHVHSTFSDGELTPEEVLDEAKKAGIEMLAFTDHDEVGAYHNSSEKAKDLGIQLIPGIELNTDGEDGELHILGYFFDPNHPDMLAHIKWRKEERKEWAKKIVARLQALDYDITFADVQKYAKGDIIVRTHIGEALCARGYFQKAEEAYHTLLIKGKPAFVQRAPFSAKEAIELIHASGGKAFLAHPGAYRFEVQGAKLLEYGLDGVEVYHSKHKEEDIEKWKQFAEQHQLFISGGSDHHGPDSRNPYPIGSVQLDENSLAFFTERVGR